MTEIKLSTLEEVESLLTKPRKGNKKRFDDVLIKKARRLVPAPLDVKRPMKVTAMEILGEEVVNHSAHLAWYPSGTKFTYTRK